MPLNLESLSDDAKTAFLARIAHTLTICARDTYEIGTGNVLNPQTLRAYNELLHQVTGSIVSRLAGSQESVESTIEMIHSFGIEQNRVEEMNWALKYALQRCSRVPDQSGNHLSGKRGGFYRSMQHHLVDLLFKDGVYGRRKTIETFFHAEKRDLAPLEGGAVVA